MIHNRYLPLWLHRLCNATLGVAVLLTIGSSLFGEPAGSWKHILSRYLIWSSIPAGIILALAARRFSIVEGVAGGDGYDELHEPPSESANKTVERTGAPPLSSGPE
jgi:hypothetical protein